jgi:hypothetical protein
MSFIGSTNMVIITMEDVDLILELEVNQQKGRKNDIHQ